MTTTSEKPGFYITTAIAYPNSRMHVGFGWEVIGSDMVARFNRMTGRPVFFCTGVDEHSQNVEKAAVKSGLSAKVYCDQMAEDIRKVMAEMDVAYDRFIRTSDPDHERVCQVLIEKSKNAGDVYKQKYEGLYCDSCEVFYTEKELAPMADGKPGCPVHKSACRALAEENYFFKLSKYEPFLKDLYKSQPNFLSPDIRRNEVLSFIENGLKDFSVSRTSFKWGIPLPFDKEHIIYVWFDALINYLSAVKFPVKDASGKVVQGDEAFFNKFWPADVHVIGKDITRFHCIFWPAMLASTEVALPKRVWAHGFINLNGEKMSKTRGNIVTPDDVTKDFGATALRWYLMSANPFDSDGNYGDELLIAKCNADLSNNIGNLVNRTVNMSIKYFENECPKNLGKLPAGLVSVQKRYEEILGANGEKLKECIEKMDTMGYCQKLIDFSMAMNKFVDETKPWSLGKLAPNDAAVKEQLSTVLAELLEGVRLLGIGMWPVVPKAAEAILSQLGIEPNDALSFTQQKLDTGVAISVPKFETMKFNSSASFKLTPPKPLFPRLEMKAEEA